MVPGADGGRFSHLEQLGLLIGASMIVCGLATLILIPALLPGRAARRPRCANQGFAAAVIGRSRTILVAASSPRLYWGPVSFACVDPTLIGYDSVNRERCCWTR